MIITQYCSVNSLHVTLNGSVILNNENAEPVQFLKSVYRQLHIQYPKFYKMDLLCKLAFLTAEVLLKNKPVISRHDPENIGIILQNTSSSLETDEKHQESIGDRNNYFPSPSVFVYTLPNIMAGEISIRHKIKGENAVLLSESPDPELLFLTVSELFSSGRVSCCITGYVEAYHDKILSCMMLVENDEPSNSDFLTEEIFIFDPSNIESIFKGNA